MRLLSAGGSREVGADNRAGKGVGIEESIFN